MKRINFIVIAILLLTSLIKGQIIEPESFPVTLGNDTIFRVVKSLGSITAEKRSQVISSHILLFAKSSELNPDSITTMDNGPETFIVYGDAVIATIFPEDTVISGQSPALTANKYAESIRESVREYRESRSLNSIITKILVIFGVVVGYYLIVRFFNWLARKLHDYISVRKWFIRELKIGDYALIDKEQSRKVLWWAVTLMKWVFLIIILYITLPVIFIQFPVTKHIAITLIQWVVSPVKNILLAVWRYLPNLFSILVILIIMRLLIKLLKFLTREVEQGELKIPGFHPDWAKTTGNIVRMLLYLFTIVIIFPFLPGSDSKVFQGVSVFLGLLLSLGSSSAISNIIAGIVITYMRPFRVGDRVKIGEIVGDVIEKSMLVTRIRTIKNEEITIPNSAILSGNTTNYSAQANESGLILHTTVTIGYDAPWRKIHELLISAALATDGIEKKPAPFVLQTSLDDFYVSYQINAVTKHASRQAVIYSQLHQNIQDKFNEAGMEIMSPHYRAERDGNTIAIPEEYRE